MLKAVNEPSYWLVGTNAEPSTLKALASSRLGAELSAPLLAAFPSAGALPLPLLLPPAPPAIKL
jgi:hypothetical protein